MTQPLKPNNLSFIQAIVLNLLTALITLGVAYIGILPQLKVDSGLGIQDSPNSESQDKGEVNYFSEVSLIDQGFELITKNGDKKIGLITLPTNQVWVNTGIYVDKEDKIKINASGSATMAIHLLVSGLQNPDKGQNVITDFWVNPDGIPMSDRFNIRNKPRRGADQFRENMLISPNNRIGTLLGCIVNENEEKLSFDYPRPENRNEIVPIGSNKEFIAYKEGYVYVTANDLIAEDTERSKNSWLLKENGTYRRDIIHSSYLENVKDVGSIDPEINNKIEELNSRWEQIVSKKYWNAFFEDNIGYYSVQIIVN